MVDVQRKGHHASWQFVKMLYIQAKEKKVKTSRMRSRRCEKGRKKR
jgi:hypothetical protein